jgi:MFS family permease
MAARSTPRNAHPTAAPTLDSPRRARVGVAVTFLVTGALFATWAARVPAIKQHLGLGDGQLAVALMALNAGAVVGLQLGGVLVPRVGSRPALRVALPAYAVALLGPGLAVSLATLSAGLFALAVANSVVDVAMNAHGITVERRHGRPILSGLHAMHSLGGIIGGALGVLAASLEVGVTAHFLAVALATTGAGLVATRRLLPARVDAAERTSRPTWTGTGGWLRGWSGRVIALGALGFALCLAEGSANDWAAVYLRDALGTSAGTAAAGVMVFMAAMTAGRLAGDRLAGRLGPVAAFRAGTALAGAGFAAALVADRPAAGLAGLALFGGGVSFTLPLVLSAAGHLPGEPAAVARASTLSYLGAFAGPGMIGALAGTVGLAAALGLVALVVAATALGASAVAPAAPTHPGPPSPPEREPPLPSQHPRSPSRAKQKTPRTTRLPALSPKR